MKTLLTSATLLLAFAVFVNAHAKPPPSRGPLSPRKEAAKNACLKKFGITDEELEKRAASGDTKDRGCFKACVNKELGVFNQDGTINKEEAIKDLPTSVSQEDRKKIVDACFEQKGADECETAELYFMCTEKLLPPPQMRQ